MIFQEKEISFLLLCRVVLTVFHEWSLGEILCHIKILHVFFLILAINTCDTIFKSYTFLCGECKHKNSLIKHE